MEIKYIAILQCLCFIVFLFIGLIFFLSGSSNGIRIVGAYSSIIISFSAAAALVRQQNKLTELIIASIGLAISAFIFHFFYALTFGATLGPALGLGQSAIAYAAVFMAVYVVGLISFYFLIMASKRS